MTSEQLTVLIDQAKKVAEAAHKGITRNDGTTPSMTHVQAVANAVEDRLKPIAFLHDTVEDSDITIQDLIDAGFPKYVTDAVDLLTHKNNEPNMSYWSKIATNKDAVMVKLADIKNNLTGQPSERQKEKYTNALALFTKLGYDVT
jgi:(p)ppGpp synthase/HD superfamily hydrolase